MNNFLKAKLSKFVYNFLKSGELCHLSKQTEPDSLWSMLSSIFFSFFFGGAGGGG